MDTYTKREWNALERAYNYCNLNSLDDDCIYKAINKYKALRDMSEDRQGKAYDYLVERLGFNR